MKKLWLAVDALAARVVGVPAEFEYRLRGLLRAAAADAREEALREVERLLRRKREEWTGDRWRAVVDIEGFVTTARARRQHIEGEPDAE